MRLETLRVKTKRTDILRNKEIDEILDKAEDYPWLQCAIAIAHLFGKRVNEIMRLKREDIYTEHGYLFIRFLVGKKKKRKEQSIPKPYLKRITLKNHYCRYIQNYVKTISEGYIFASGSKPRIKRFLDKTMNVWREYTSEGGHITPELAYYYLKKLAPQTWWHLFRESLATEMAEHGATEEELLHWFDWDRSDTAHAYVKRGTKLTEKYSERTW